MRRSFLILAALLPLTLLAWGLTQNPRQADDDPEAGARSAALNAARDALIVGSSAQVLAGAETYDTVCAACHGDTGLGYAEGQQSSPQATSAAAAATRPETPT